MLLLGWLGVESAAGQTRDLSLGILAFNPNLCQKVHPRPAVGPLFQPNSLSKRAAAEASPYLIILPCNPKKRRFFQHGISALTYKGSRQGLRVEWEFRLCSPWPEPKILLLIKLSQASLSAQAPRDGSHGSGAATACHNAHGSCKSSLVADLLEFYRELKDFGCQRGLCRETNPSGVPANLVILKG